MTRFDSILLGDNPLFGVDHLSYERGRQRSLQTDQIKNAIEVVQYSYEFGIKDMMVSTRPQLAGFLKSLKNDTDLANKIEFHPLVPYVQGYILKLSQKGMINTMKDIFSSGGLKHHVGILARGGMGLVKKDLSDLFKVFLDMELANLKNFKINTVFLHPAITDLVLALKQQSIFETFKDHLQSNGVQAGLCTKNFPRLIDALNEWQLDISNIMASFNNVGFQMNPSKIECEQYLSNYGSKVTAMSLFAGGYVEFSEVKNYLVSQPKLRNIVVGISTKEHARQTFESLQAI